MRTIGIRELKARLSQVLRDVAKGDAYLVTDCGRAVAELRRPDAGAELTASTALVAPGLRECAMFP
jgi:antitoxin (DNA-binding transcriptional repressor) of toxin-antitoxin stability system